MQINSAIIRYGEISLKGRNRFWFEDRLKRDLEYLLHATGESRARVIRMRGRFYLHDIENVPPLEQVLGITSYSPSYRLPRSLDAVYEALPELFPLVRQAKSFRVSCQRVDKTFPLTSVEVEQKVGDILFEATHTRVQLKNPDLEVQLEIGAKGIYLFAGIHRGYGGFPFGTARGQVGVLLSGGLDSPVAAFLMMKRGVSPFFIHFKVSEQDFEKVLAIRTLLERFSAGRRLDLWVMNRDDLFDGRFEEFRQDKRLHGYLCLFCKSLMHRTAGGLIRRLGGLGLVTGDSLAQVASQTLSNLFAYHTDSQVPVYSPLIGMDKVEIMHLARNIGTYETSSRKVPACIPPSQPRTSVERDFLLRRLAQTGLETEGDRLAERLVLWQP